MPADMPRPRGRTLLLVRHGQTEYNRQRLRCGGDVDVGLTAEGAAQMREAGARLAGAWPGIEAILASPLLRTRESAAILQPFLGCPVIERPELRERLLGAWNGLSVPATDPWIRAGATPPGGESDAAFSARVLPFLDWLAGQPQRLVVAVVSKGIGRLIGRRLAGESYMIMENGEIAAFALPAAGADDGGSDDRVAACI